MELRSSYEVKNKTLNAEDRDEIDKTYKSKRIQRPNEDILTNRIETEK